jgi:hypothetical protein
MHPKRVSSPRNKCTVPVKKIEKDRAPGYLHRNGTPLDICTGTKEKKKKGKREPTRMMKRRENISHGTRRSSGACTS